MSDRDALVTPTRAAGSALALGLGLLVGLSAPASALIIDDPGNARPLLTPPTAAIGTWGGNASAVAIGPNHILTTRHQDGSSGSPALRQVNFNGTTYNSVSQTLFDPGGQNWDVRLVEIEQTNGSAANLTDFLPVYTLSVGESLVGQRVVMGAHGLTGTGEDAAGFDWQAFGGGSPAANSYGVNFGENVIDSSDTQNDNGFNGGMRWVGDFDGPNDAGALTYESTVAPGDSGGAVMMYRYDQWWLVGLPNAVEEATGSLPDAFFTQEWFASDVTGLAGDIETAIGGGFTFPDPKPLPEPGSLALLAGLGTLALRRRK